MQVLIENRPIRETMAVVTMSCAMAAVLAGGLVAAYDYQHLLAGNERELQLEGDLVAAVVGKPLAEGDARSAEQALQLVAGDQRVTSVWLYRVNGGKPLAGYFRPGARLTPMPSLASEGVTRYADSLLLIREVGLNGEPVGRLAILLDTKALQAVLVRDLAIGILLLVMSGFMGLAVFLRLRNVRRDVNFGQEERAEDAVVPPVVALGTGAEAGVVEQVRELREGVVELRTRMDALEGGGRVEENRPGTSRTGKTSSQSGEFLARLRELMRPEKSNGSTQAADLWEFLQLEASAVTLVRDEINVWEILLDTAMSFASGVPVHGPALVLEIHPDVPRMVIGDQPRLVQTLRIVLENTMHGDTSCKTILHAAQLFKSDRSVGIHFWVRGAGRSLTPAAFARAVEPFGEGPDAGSQGLGLAIASRLVALMGGTFWLESEPDSGSALHFSVTFATVAEKSPAGHNARGLAGTRVLVLDTNASTRLSLQQMLGRWGIVPTLAATSQEAIEFMRRAASARQAFEIVLVDSGMSVAGGRGIASEIHEHPELGSPVILALVSLQGTPVAELGRQVSDYNYLIKPVSEARLMSALSDANGALGRSTGAD